MFRSYFKIAIRNLSRHRLVSIINILGIAVGLACCILILMYVQFETSYDNFHSKADRIFRITMEYSADNTVNKVSVTGNKVLTAFKREFPEVETGVRTYPASAVVRYGDKVFDEKGFTYADSTFFDVFSFQLLRGNPQSVLARPNTIVLSASTAKKYFGSGDPIGKSLKINNEKDYEITGVVTDCPANSQIKYDMLASFSSLRGDRFDEESWWDASYLTYLLLKSPDAANSLQVRIPGYMKAQDKDNGINNGNYLTYFLEPLRRVHLYSTVEGGFEPAGDYRYVVIFSIIALLIMCIACFNYVNLTTARATSRAREVGIRKLMGAVKKTLIRQFLGESILTAAISSLFGLLLVSFLLPTFNAVSGKQLSFSNLLQPGSMLFVIVIILGIGILGGLYPAFVLSKYDPAKVLKGNFKSSASGVWLRKGLIMIQFFISVGLIVSTIVIQSQLNYIQNKKLGYNRDQILVLPLDKILNQKLDAFKTELLANSSIQNITTCNQTPAFIPGKYSLSLDHREMSVTAVRTDKDFVKTLQLSMVSGLDFSPGDQALVDSENIVRPLLLNEAAVKMLGWTSAEAVGKKISFQGRDGYIKGVVNDFHFSSMHQAISPFVVFLSHNTRNLLVKLSGSEVKPALDAIRKAWTAMAPHRPFEYEFLDDQFNELYSAENRTGKLFYNFSLLAIGLACLGLFGLVSFTAGQRKKEIGIRKVLGASVRNIISLLSGEFVRLVLLASLVAIPVAWFAMHRWLDDFAYRIELNWWMFAVAAGAALLIAVLTVLVQAIQVAVENPVKSLRTE